jgi:NAD(P)-dependent dehydrogenase (short-subunit alcohol dehydrogenase family)
MGAKRIIMAVRTPSKGETALAAIRRETQRRNVGEVWELDLTSLDSVETFAKRISELDRLDGLIANAGVVMGRFQTVQGLELSLIVNVVATMLLAFRALPKLQESAHKLKVQTHLVIVSSNTGLELGAGDHVEALQGDVFDALSVEKSFKVMSQ